MYIITILSIGEKGSVNRGSLIFMFIWSLAIFFYSVFLRFMLFRSKDYTGMYCWSIPWLLIRSMQYFYFAFVAVLILAGIFVEVIGA